MKNSGRILTILDTDIGCDIDDTWALAMLLRSPELDTIMVTTAAHNTVYRAKICAKLLERAGRQDIPVGIGIPGTPVPGDERQLNWVKEYDLKNYPGTVYEDGVQAMIKAVEQADVPVTIVAIGPMTNLGAITERAPHLTGKINLVAMIGSIGKGLDGKPGRIAEYNVVQDIPAARKVFNAGWNSMTITPLDTCGVVRLRGELYDRLVKSADPLVKDLLENYTLWSNGGRLGPTPDHSSILFDTVAVHLARTADFLQMRQMRLRVDDRGFLIDDESGQEINVAIEWKDLEGYKQFLVDRLLGLR